MFKHILVPTDGSRLSKKAEHAAIQLARRFKAHITGLHVVAVAGPVPLEAWAHGDARYGTHLDQTLAGRAGVYLQTLREAALCAGVTCDCQIAHGTPHQEIIRAAKRLGCDVIVMATHRKDSRDQSLLESETTRVSALSTVPVLIWH